jgi:hypothetical protein
LRKCNTCKVLLLSVPGSRRRIVPSGKSFFVNSREGQISAKAKLLVAGRADQPWNISGPGYRRPWRGTSSRRRKFCSLLAPAGMVGYNHLFVAGMGGMVLFFQSRQACAFHGADLSLSKLRSCEPLSVAGSGRSGDLHSVPSRALAPL